MPFILSWSNSSFWSLLTAVFSVAISSFVSLLIALFLGPRHVEKEHRRREHSIRLMTDGLIPWRDGRGLFCTPGFEYSPETNRIEPKTPKNPEKLVLLDAVKEHLVSGHPEVLQEWEDYKLAVLQHSQNIAQFLEGIKKQIASSTDLPEYHYLFRENEPAEYVIPVKAAEEIYSWLRYESVNGKRWVAKANVRSYVEGETSLKWYTLEFSSATLAKAKSPQRFDSIISTIEAIGNSSQNKQRVDQFVRIEREDLAHKERQFEDRINNIIRSVQLGNCLKGRCRDCPA